jgi:hypothetical protein
VERALRIAVANRGPAEVPSVSAVNRRIMSLMVSKCAAGGNSAVYNVPNFEALGTDVAITGMSYEFMGDALDCGSM